MIVLLWTVKYGRGWRHICIYCLPTRRVLSLCVCVECETRLQKYWIQCLHDCYSALGGFVRSTKWYESDSTEVSSCGWCADVSKLLLLAGIARCHSVFGDVSKAFGASVFKWCLFGPLNSCIWRRFAPSKRRGTLTLKLSVTSPKSGSSSPLWETEIWHSS
jgi:hypothetical protein